MFYTTSQNNSGGSFIQDDFVDHLVCVEADNHTEAEKIMGEIIDIGDYNSNSCPCCGDYFYVNFYEGDGTEFISDSYGGDILNTSLDHFDKQYRRYVIVHYKNGNRKKYDLLDKIWTNLK